MTLETGRTTTGDDTPVALIRPVEAARPRRRHMPRRPSKLRWALLVVGLLLGAMFGYYLVSLYQVWSTGRGDGSRPVDAIVVMGAAQYDGEPSPLLAARLDHVADLWPQGLAPLIVVTGGKRAEDRFTEAEASAAYLVERGVPQEAIVLENEGANSYESLEGVSELLAARGLDEVLIVTDPYHSLRSRLIAEDVGLRAWASPTPYSVVDGSESFGRHLEEAAGVALGRLIGFDNL